MRMMLNRGHRIRASDKTLVYRFCAGTLLFLFLAVLLLLEHGQLMRTDWELLFQLIEERLDAFSIQLHSHTDSRRYMCTCSLFCITASTDSFKKHRQKLQFTADYVLKCTEYTSRTVWA